MTVKCVITEGAWSRIRNAERGRNVDSKFRDSHITGKHPSSEDTRQCDEGEYFDVAAPWGQAAESKPMQQTCIGWICYYGSSKMRNAFKLETDDYRIIVSYCYRDNFDLSYRLSIENSIWHIVTALEGGNKRCFCPSVRPSVRHIYSE